MKIDENSVKINEIDDDDDDDCGGDGGSSSILYQKTPDQPPLAATMLILMEGRNRYDPLVVDPPGQLEQQSSYTPWLAGRWPAVGRPSAGRRPAVGRPSAGWPAFSRPSAGLRTTFGRLLAGPRPAFCRLRPKSYDIAGVYCLS